MRRFFHISRKTAVFVILLVFVFSGLHTQPVSADMHGITEDPAQLQITPRKVEMDTTGDGQIDRVEHYKDGQVEKIKVDISGDGKFNEVIYFDKGRPVRSERDSNLDGNIDTWITY